MKRKRKNTNGATQISVKPAALRPSAIESEIIVPLSWTLIVSTAVALVSALATLVLRVALDARWEWWLPFAVAGGAWAVVLLWRVSVVETDRRELLLWPLEVAMGTDLDRDGYVGEPGAEVTIEPVEADPRLIYVHDPRQEARRRNAGDFRHFIRGAYDGRGTTWREWDGHQLPSGNQVTRVLWEAWTARLQKAGLATRPRPTASLELTGGYRQALETLRELL